MKKILGIISGIIFSLFLVGCSNGYTMDKVTGTYKLTKYIYDYFDSSIKDEDIKEKNNIEAYLVVTGEKYGYYIYKDNDRKIDAKEVLLTYKYDSTDEAKITGIEYSLEISELKYGVPGGFKEALKLDDKSLYSKTEGSSSKGHYYQRVEYEKINKDTSLKSLEEKLETNIPYISYPMYKMNAAFIFSCARADEDRHPYLYYVLLIDGYKMEATIYYALKSDKEDVVVENIEIKYENIDGIEIITINEKEYTYVNYYPSYLFNLSNDFATTMYRNPGLDIADYINQVKAELN